MRISNLYLILPCDPLNESGRLVLRRKPNGITPSCVSMTRAVKKNRNI